MRGERHGGERSEAKPALGTGDEGDDGTKRALGIGGGGGDMLTELLAPSVVNHDHRAFTVWK